eukprot:497233_1
MESYPIYKLFLTIISILILPHISTAWYPENPTGNLVNPKATYSMKLSTAAWFIGNVTGLNNITELNAEAKYGCIGIGWEVNNIDSNFTNEDKSCNQTAISLKQINPFMQTLAPRNTECVGVIYNIIRKAIESNQYELFLTNPNNSTEIYIIPWSSGVDEFNAAWINFLNNDSIDWFLSNWIEPAVQNNNFDGIYWDGCGPKPDIILNDKQYQQWQNGSKYFWQKANEIILKYNKWSMSWHGYYFNATNISYFGPELCSNQISDYIQIAKQIDVDFSFMYNYQDIGKYDPSLWLALFLIIRGKSATFMMKVHGGFDLALSFPFDNDWNVDYGVPRQDAYQIQNNIFFRAWSKANVTFNCNDMSYSIVLKKQRDFEFSSIK